MSLDHQQVIEALPAYQIENEIGRGGWGVVLSATHLGLGRRVAIKQLPRAFGADPAVRQRFREEARLVASLTHPHIVPIFDFVEHDGLCLIVMELLTGGTLWDRFLEHGVPLDEACALICAACTALQHAHDHGILHRDIKPENFLFSDTGTIKLGDFGIAKVVGQSAAALTVAGSIMGTPAYMAPEQALGRRLGPGTDIYSLGVMLYELSCGDLPFPETQDPLSQLIDKTEGDPRPLVQLRADIHPALAEVTMRAIAREPEDRYASAQDLGMAVAEAATKAFGAGWLRRCGVEVMSAPQLIAITEQTFTSVAPSMHPIRLQRATSQHPRIGTLLKEARLSGEVTPPLVGTEQPPVSSEVVGFAPPAPAAPAAAPLSDPVPSPAPTFAPVSTPPATFSPPPAAPLPSAPTPAPAPAPVPAPPPTPAPGLDATQVPAWLPPPSSPSAPPPTPLPPPVYQNTSYPPPAAYAPTPAPPPAAPPPAAPPARPTPPYVAPMPGPAPAGSPPSGSKGKSIAIMAGAIVIATVLVGGAWAFSRSGTGTIAGPAVTTTLPTATTASTEAPTTTSSSTTTTRAPLPLPEITKLTVVSATSVSLDWVDDLDPTAAHVLIAYTSGGKKQQYPITDTPQDVQFAANAPYCFEIAAIGSTIRRSDPKCVNGADPAVVVVHDDPFSTSTTQG
jgi:serine/threonine protein kinase